MSVDRDALQRVPRCVSCDLPLPILICPPDDDRGASWRCTFCDCRYFGLIDPDADPNVRVNVSPAT